MNANSPRRTVGVIELPAVTAALVGAGYEVVTGDGFRPAAAAIRTALAVADRPFPVLVAGISPPGLKPWMERVAQVTDVGYLPARLAVTGPPAAVQPVRTPVAVNDLLEAFALDPHDALAGLVLHEDGTLESTGGRPGPPPARATAPSDVDPWAQDDPPPPAQEPDRVRAPQPAPVDPWDDDAAPATPPFGAAPAVARDDDPPPAAPDGGPVSRRDLHRASATSLFHTPPPARARGRAPAPGPGRGAGDVIVSFAARGGVGKSTFALALAQRAATTGRLRVTLIDANRGQGDLRKYLRLGEAPDLATAYDAALTGRPDTAILTPDVIAKARPARLGRVEFALVQAPPVGVPDPHRVNADVYADVIDHARSVSDLVVVDTQTMEATDTSTLFDTLFVPLLRAGAWGLATSDSSVPGVENLHERLTALTRVGVPTGRIMIALNRVPEQTPFRPEHAAAYYAGLGEVLGAVHVDHALKSDTDAGRLFENRESIAPVLDAALYRVRGDEVFAPRADQAARRRRPWPLRWAS